MMTYKLRCAAGHGFEGWFRSSADFERQTARTLLSCPVCGSRAIEKAIMAPAVVTGRQQARQPALAHAAVGTRPASEAEPRQEVLPAVTTSEAHTAKLLAMMRQIQAHVEKNFENVGQRFAEEARKMHHGEIDHRDVYGQATMAEAKELIEEGVPVLPLPKLPKLDG